MSGARSPSNAVFSHPPRHAATAGSKRHSETASQIPTPARSQGEIQLARDRELCIRCFRRHDGSARNCRAMPVRSVKAFLRLGDDDTKKYDL